PLRVEHAPLDESVFAQRHAFCSPTSFGDREFESCHRTNHDSKVSTAVRGERSGDVFPQEPSSAAKMSSCIEDSELMVKEPRSLAGQARALARDRQVLAG